MFLFKKKKKKKKILKDILCKNLTIGARNVVNNSLRQTEIFNLLVF